MIKTRVFLPPTPGFFTWFAFMFSNFMKELNSDLLSFPTKRTRKGEGERKEARMPKLPTKQAPSYGAKVSR